VWHQENKKAGSVIPTKRSLEIQQPESIAWAKLSVAKGGVKRDLCRFGARKGAVVPQASEHPGALIEKPLQIGTGALIVPG